MTDDEEPRSEQPSDQDRSFRLLGGIFAVLFLINLAANLLSGAFELSLISLVFGPLLGAGLVVVSVTAVRDVRRGRPLPALVGLVLMGGPVVWIVSGAFARSMMFPGAAHALPATGTEVSPGVRVVEYTTEDGIVLRGLLGRGSGAEPRPSAVFFHGNGESVVFNKGIAAGLVAQNMDVLVAEFRGYGGCAGSPSRPGLILDARAAFAALEAETKSPTTLVIGRSVGTGLATEMAAEGHGRAVLLVSPYTSIRAMGERMVPAFLVRVALRDDFDNVANLSRCTQPVSVFHGTRDPIIPYAQGKAVVESLGARGKLFTAEGVGHNDIFVEISDQIFAEAARLARAN